LFKLNNAKFSDTELLVKVIIQSNLQQPGEV